MKREFSVPHFGTLPGVLTEIEPVPAAVLSLAIENVARAHAVAVTAAALRRAADWLEDK